MQTASVVAVHGVVAYCLKGHTVHVRHTVLLDKVQAATVYWFEAQVVHAEQLRAPDVDE